MNPLELEKVTIDLLKAGATLGFGRRAKDILYEIQTYGTSLIKEFERNMNANDNEKQRLLNRRLEIITRATEYRWITLLKNRRLLSDDDRAIITHYASKFAQGVQTALEDETVRKHLKEECQQFDTTENLRELELDEKEIQRRLLRFKTHYQSSRQLGRRRVLEGQHLLQIYRLLNPVLCLEELERYLMKVEEQEECDDIEDIISREEVSNTIEHLRTWTKINNRISILFKHSKECKQYNRETEITKEYEDRQVTIQGCGNAYTTMTPAITSQRLGKIIKQKYQTWSITTLDRFNNSGRLHLTINEDKINGRDTLISQLKEREICIIIRMNVQCEMKLRYERDDTLNLYMIVEDNYNEIGEEIIPRLMTHKMNMDFVTKTIKQYMTSQEAIKYQQLQDEIADELSTWTADDTNQNAQMTEGDCYDDKSDSDYTRVD